MYLVNLPNVAVHSELLDGGVSDAVPAPELPGPEWLGLKLDYGRGDIGLVLRLAHLVDLAEVGIQNFRAQSFQAALFAHQLSLSSNFLLVAVALRLK